MNRLDLLRATPLFRGCSEQALEALDRIATDRTFDDGRIVLSHGEEARDLMILASGAIQLELPLTILGESRSIPFEAKARGDVIGWSALVPPHRFTLSARVSGEASVVVLARAELAALLEADPGLGFQVMKNLASIVGQRLHLTQEMWSSEIQRSLQERYR
ncbi:MAG: cyclic nucleotide-binding domain-containing protein [Planctomycetota bacterium]|jgi:CRP-like cAMP-binding protein